MDESSSAAQWIERRERIHDMRNLFIVITSAQRLIRDDTSRERRILLLRAIEEAAVSGARLASQLAAAAGQEPVSSLFDLNHVVRRLEPLLCALVGPKASLELELTNQELPLFADASAMEAVLIELVANARAALTRSGRVRIRTRRKNNHAWLLIADNGNGMPGWNRRTAPRALELAIASGSGLGRVHRFTDRAPGRLRIHSRKDMGTVVLLDFPLARLSGASRGQPADARRKEMEGASS